MFQTSSARPTSPRRATRALGATWQAAFEAKGGTITAVAAHEDGKADYSAEVGTLAAAGVPNPEVDAELLVGHVLGISRGQVQARAIGGSELGLEDYLAVATAVVAAGALWAVRRQS